MNTFSEPGCRADHSPKLESPVPPPCQDFRSLIFGNGGPGNLVCVLAIVLLAALSTPLNAAILLNEIHLRTPPTTDTVPADSNFEFVELKSTTGGVELCTDLWILVIDNDGGGVGEIKQAWELRNADGSWMATGTNGLLLLGENYNKPGSPWQFIKAPLTAMGDPKDMGPDNIPDLLAVSFLLVSGYTNPPSLGTNKPDIDMDDDGTGVFDWLDPTPPVTRYTAPLWTSIVDSVGFNGNTSNLIRIAYAPANLSRSNAVSGVPQAGSTIVNFFPHTMARSATNNTANSRTAWYGGMVFGTSTDSDSVIYDVSYFNMINTWKGQVTPGRPNLSSAPVSPVFRINEINLNPPGTPGRSPDPATPWASAANDGKFEFIEIINTTANQAGGSDFSGSLAGYALLMVESGGATVAMGTIREAWNLNKYATGTNGLLVLGDDGPDGYSPFAASFDPTTQLADPDPVADISIPSRFKYSKLDMGDLANNGVTFFLVRAFTGLVDIDIDTNDDGILNVQPWSDVVDSVSLPEIDGNHGLVTGRGGYSPARPDIVVNSRHYIADNLSRIPGNSAAGVTGAWSAGVFGSNSPYSLAYRNGFNFTGSGPAFRGAASPGKANYSSTVPPAAGVFRINEINLNPPTSVDATEYVEVISAEPHALMTNLWLLILDATPGGSGEVKKVIDLRGQSTGANRLAIFAGGIDEDTSALAPYLSARTVRDDPVSFNGDGTVNGTGGFNFTPNSIEPNDGVSVLLVAYAPATATGVPATPGADLDVNNDGILDAASPWTLVDGISTGNGVGDVRTLTPGGYSPGNLCRYAGKMAANSAKVWFGGELTGGTATSFNYSTNFFGTFKGAASPGRQNVTATPDDAVPLLLNEININPPGGDNNKEFVELRSADNSAMSTNGYSVVLVDNDGPGTGRVLEVWDLDGAATGPNGLLLAGTGYNTVVPWTGDAAPGAATKLFGPESMDSDDIGNYSDNGAVTVLLVQNFRGLVGDDLDDGAQLDQTAVDDHIFNTPVPWSQLSDSVAMQFFAVSVFVPNFSLQGFIFPDTADLTVPIPSVQANGYTPDTVARFAGNSAANDRAAWYGGNISGSAATSTGYDPVQYFPSTLYGGKVTPGQLNIRALADDSDTDGDGVPYLMESALGMNAFTPDSYKLPRPSMQTVGLILQPAFMVTRPSGVAGIDYVVEASFDLQSWDIPVMYGFAYPDSPAPGYETQVFVISPDFLPQLQTNRRVYFRLKVSR